LAKTLMWQQRASSILDAVQKDKLDIWTRRNIEKSFEVSRPTAQRIIKAIGDVERVLGTYTVSRSSLVAYLQEIVRADDPVQIHKERISTFKKIERCDKVSASLPPDLRDVTASDLPANIEMRSGFLSFRGDNAKEVIDLVALFIAACQHDRQTVEETLDPPQVVQTTVDDDELRSLFAGLRAREAAHVRAKATSRDLVCTAH
jgi:hypothetical protein